ncbi:MAG: hypothetical protein R3D67_00690 [Hyphomicrobiaceae bacterium]
MLLATKAWAPAAFPLMRDSLDGTTASGEYEARMGAEEFGKEVHVYAPAYGPGEVERLVGLAQHIYFNSPNKSPASRPLRGRGAKIGIRINPGYSNASRSAARSTILARRARGSVRRWPTSVLSIGAGSKSCTCMRCARARLTGRWD